MPLWARASPALIEPQYQSEILDCSDPASKPQIDDDFEAYNIGQNLDTQSPFWEYACEHFSNNDHSVVCDHGGTKTGDKIIGHAACSDGITNGAGCSTYTAESYSYLKVCTKLDLAEVTKEFSALLLVDAAAGGDENDDGYYLDLRLPGRLALRTKPTDTVLAANNSVNYGEGDTVCLAFWDNAGTPTLTGTLNGAVAVEATDGLAYRGPFYATVFISRDQRDLTLVNGFDDFGVAACGTKSLNQAPNGVIDTPASSLTINVGDTLDFSGTATDPDGDLPLSYHWTFGSGSGVPDSSVEDPGLVQFYNAGSFTVTFTATDALGLADLTPAVRLVTAHVMTSQPLPQGSWSLLYTTSEHPGYEAIYAFDGDPKTLWHTNYDTPVPHPHELQIDLGGLYTSVSGIRYLPRQDDTNARVKDYALYLSTDGINWGSPVATGIFPNNALQQEALFTPAPAAFVRFVALSAHDGSDLSTIGELNVLGNLGSLNQAPNGVIDTPASLLTTINVGDTLDFSGTATDPDGDLPLSYHWTFGNGSGVPDSSVEDPGLVQFYNAGNFAVTFTATDAFGLADPTPAVRLVTAQVMTSQPLPQGSWSLLYTTSEHPGYEAIYAFDGDPKTLWHTNYDTPVPHPHELQIDLGGLYTSVSGIRYLPRQDDTNARVKDYALYLSTDGINWGSPVATGIFPNNALQQEVLFTPAPAAFVRFVALSAHDGSRLSTVGELNVLGNLGSLNHNPSGTFIPGL